jgi:CheY-like chemotaxis protein
MLNCEAISALIIDDDPTGESMLRPLLEGAGYRVTVAQDPSDGLAILRSSQQQMLVLFDVNLTAYTMSGLDSVLVLGALLEDARLSRHAYILTTESPDAVSLAFGKLLARLGVPVVAKPFDAIDVRAVLAAVRDRLEVERILDGVPA